VKHIPARGVASIFKEAEIISTEIFIVPAGGFVGTSNNNGFNAVGNTNSTNNNFGFSGSGR
jgi:hypothetical protein